jgi:hypothetical protein
MLGEDTPNKHPNLRAPWQPGQSGNPAGRPKGARSKLSEDFFKALQADFETHGLAAIVSMRTERPNEYVKAIVALQTKEISGEDGDPLNIGAVTQSALRLHRAAVEPGQGHRLDLPQGIHRVHPRREVQRERTLGAASRRRKDQDLRGGQPRPASRHLSRRRILDEFGDMDPTVWSQVIGLRSATARAGLSSSARPRARTRSTPSGRTPRRDDWTRHHAQGVRDRPAGR